MALYSWPSKGNLSGYFADSNTVLGSVPFLVEFLRGFYEKLNESVSKVHLVAHSMGNRVVLDAINELNREFDSPIFDQVILAAADVDQQTFIQKAAAYREIAKRTTLYISNKDKALMLSEFGNSANRAGYFDPVTLFDGIDTIRTNKVSQGFLGHGYYADSRALLTDIHQLMQWNAEPAKRATIRKVSEASGLNWELAE